MTTQYQKFDAYAEGSTVPSDFFESGSSATNAIFWIINGNATALAAAAMDGGARGARITAANNVNARTQGYHVAAGQRASFSAFLKFPSGANAIDLSATTGTLGTLFGLGDLLGIGIDKGKFTVFHDSTTVLTTGPVLAADTVYFIQGGSYASGDTTGGSRVEARILQQVSPTTYAEIGSIDTGYTIASGAGDGGRMILAWGNVSGMGNGVAADTPQTLSTDYDYVAWSDELSTWGTFPGFQPTLVASHIATSDPSSGQQTVTATGSALIDPAPPAFGTAFIDVSVTTADIEAAPRLAYLNPFLSITIWNRAFQFQQSIGDPIYASITPRWPGVGSAEIQLRATDPANEWLQKPGANITVVYKDSETVFSGPVDSYQGSILAGGTVTYQFTDWYTLFRETLGYVMPTGNVAAGSLTDEAQTYLAPGLTHTAGAADGSGYYHWTSNVPETAIKAIASANFARLGRPVVVRSSRGLGGTLTSDQMPQVRFDDLQSVCEEMAVLGGLRIRLWLEPGDSHLTLDVVPISTYSRKLTYESGVLQDGKYSVQSPQATRVIVGGPGEDTARAFYPLSNPTDELAWRPIETFKDATSNADLVWPSTFTDAQKVPKYYPVQTDPGITTAQKVQFNRTLLQAAADVLAGSVSKSGIEVRLSETDAWHYGGTDGFAVGDVVTVSSGGVTFQDQITEVTLAWTVESFVVTPVVGSRTDDPDVLLLQAVRHLATSLRSTSTER